MTDWRRRRRLRRESVGGEDEPAGRDDSAPRDDVRSESTLPDSAPRDDAPVRGPAVDAGVVHLALPCPNCGASARAADGTCSYCSASLPAPVAVPAQRTPAEARAARFDALRAHPQFRAALADLPRVATFQARWALPAAFGLVFAGTSCGIVGVPLAISRVARRVTDHAPAVVGDVHRAADGAFAAFGSLFVLVGLGISAIAIVRWITFARAPVAAFAAQVSSRRTDVSGTRNSTTTTYYVTLETRSGERHEYMVDAPLFGAGREDEVGVAYTKVRRLVGFRRFDV